MQKHHLTPKEFSQIVRLTPFVSIDLILSDPDGRVLLGLRNNEPAKGFYFVPGGIIRKNERISHAFARILKDETGLDIPRSDARPLGVYEHFYETNRLNKPGFGTHYVVLAHELRLSRRPSIKADGQHSEIVWWTLSDILGSPQVHDNTKAYFREPPSLLLREVK